MKAETDAIVAAMVKQNDDLLAALSKQHADHVAALSEQHEDHVAALAEQAQGSKDERDVLFDHVYTISRRLAALEAAPPVGNRTASAGNTAGGLGGVGSSSCNGAAAGCTTELFSHDVTGALTLTGPQVVFESDKCAPTDLCVLQNQVQSLLDKFNGTGPA